MRTKSITGANKVDMGIDSPLGVGNTVVAINTGTAADTLQFGDSADGPFFTAVVIPAGGSVEVKVERQFAAIENGAGSIVILAN